MTYHLDKVTPRNPEFDRDFYHLYWHFNRSLTKVKDHLTMALETGDADMKCQLQAICGGLPWYDADIKDALKSLGKNYTILPKDWAPEGASETHCPHCGQPFHEQIKRRRPRVWSD